jgi:ribosomal protein S18 acetylase RimI-like enzyme
MDSNSMLFIRRVDPFETEALCSLAERTFRDAWQDDNDPENFEAYCRENFLPEKLSAELAQPGVEYYFALINEQPVAYLKLNIDRPLKSPGDSESPGDCTSKAVQLERVYVLKDFQGQRVGEKLLQFSEKRCREAGAKWLWLSVWQKSPRSIKFYERNGFEIFGIETFWVGNDAQPDWLMQKKVLD